MAGNTQQFDLPGVTSTDPTKGQPEPVKSTVSHNFVDGKLESLVLKLETQLSPVLEYNVKERTVTVEGHKYNFTHFLTVANLLIEAINGAPAELPKD